jgi:hypothetical protein
MGWGWVEDILKGATKYAPLIKTGVAALSTYASYKDQKKKNELQQDAYDDYMAQAAAAGHEAQAAIDLNLTPMAISGVPTTKADVTDFTAVAAQGGLMSIPNKQRKRYAAGPAEFEIEQMDEEVFSPGDFKMETGVDVLGEQVFYDTGKGDRSNAKMIWNQMQDPDKATFDFDFEIFFMDGSWKDMIRGQVDVEEDTQLASAPSIEDSQNEMSMNIFNKPYHQLNQEEIDILNDMGAAAPGADGIMQAAHGGRIGYEEGTRVADLDAVKDGYSELWYGKPVHELTPEQLDDFEILFKMEFGKKGNAPQGVMAAAQGGRIGYQEGIGPNQGSPAIMANAATDMEVEDAYGVSVGDEVLQRHIRQIAEQSASPQDFPATDSDYSALEKLSEQTDVSLEEIIQVAKALNFEAPEQTQGEVYAQYMARGGRPGYALGSSKDGIMNLGGLEKDYRTTGGFVPIGAYEKKDDVPARLSKNEFVMTADAVRAAGGGSINKGAQRMYDTMKHLEAQPQAKRMRA